MREIKINILFSLRTLAGTQKNDKNMKLICMSSIENASKVSRYCDASCQANCESLTELSDFEIKVNYIRIIIKEIMSIRIKFYNEHYTELIDEGRKTQNKFVE